MTEWALIHETNGRYEVNRRGEVRGINLRSRQRILKVQTDSNGYLHYLLRCGPREKPRMFYVHRIVCAAFNGSAPEGSRVVRHLNGDNKDNRPENLSWGTQRENIQDALRHGTFPIGSRKVQALLTEAKVKAMRESYAAGVSTADLAAANGVTWGTANHAISRRTWRHVA